MKQFTPWRVRQLTDGILEWTSPLGHTYTDQPEPPTTFTPDQPDQPEPDEPDDGADAWTESNDTEWEEAPF